MSYMPVDEHPRCNFRKCAAGLGLAGMGSCFLGGQWDNPDCPKFEDESAFILEMHWTWNFTQMGYGGEIEQEFTP